MEIRLAVIVATQPLTNRTRALAMSSDGEDTAAPNASTLSISLSTSDSTRSRSWIIRSRITDTSVPRGLYGAIRVASIYNGRVIRLLIARCSAENRSKWPTCNTNPFAAASAASASACAKVAAIGFSTSTWHPASSACVAKS